MATAAVFAFCLLTVTDLCASAQAAEVKTGVDLSEHVLKAYTEKWKYSYGSYDQLRNGARYADCSGLIKSCLWQTGDRTNPSPSLSSVSNTRSGMLKGAKSGGTINYSNWSSLPKAHGLVLYQPGHVGVHVGNSVGVDNRDIGYDMKKEPVLGRARNKRTTWFKLTQLSYPATGFVAYDGNRYHYENGEYVIKTTRTIRDKIYTTGTDRIIIASTLTPEAQARQATALAGAAAKTAVESAQQAAMSEPVPVDAMQTAQTLLSPVS